MAERVIEKDNKKIDLTKNEYSILYYLSTHKEKVVSRDEIMDYLWESEEFIDDNTLNVNIKRLRTKLEELGVTDKIETKSIDEELDKVENYIEQALFYARSNAVEKDYIINKTNLKEIVNSSILKNKSTLLNEKVAIELKDIEQEVYTDSKWATFIINQIIQNAIKYSKKENKKIEIYSKTKYEFLILISSKKYIAQLIFWNL